MKDDTNKKAIVLRSVIVGFFTKLKYISVSG